MRRLLTTLLALSLVLVACGGTDTALQRNLEPTTAAEVINERLGAEDFVLLDVRTLDEVQAGYIDGAIVIDFYDASFQDAIAALDRDKTYVVYCRSGNRSGSTLDLMDNLGFTTVSDIDGGILAWASAGLPISLPS